MSETEETVLGVTNDDKSAFAVRKQQDNWTPWHEFLNI